MHRDSNFIVPRRQIAGSGLFSLLLGLLMTWITVVSDSLASQTPSSKLTKPFAHGKFSLEHGDVVAFLGGTDVAAAQHTGHLETLLTAKYRDSKIRFRNFGWEGDTVFAQPRDIGFPTLKMHMEREQISVVILQFGRMESLGGRDGLPGFIAAYETFLDECAQQTPRLLLVTPPPFEKSSSPSPDIAARNFDLAEYAKAIRKIARRRGLPLVDLFGEFYGRNERLTGDGLQFTTRGQAILARSFVRELGFGKIADRAGELDGNGSWLNADFENLHRTILEKNKLWFNYWRPQNWAFLGGDRINQPSSWDHRDLNLRWFPQEMKKFIPLIEEREREINELAKKL